MIKYKTETSTTIPTPKSPVKTEVGVQSPRMEIERIFARKKSRGGKYSKTRRRSANKHGKTKKY